MATLMKGSFGMVNDDGATGPGNDKWSRGPALINDKKASISVSLPDAVDGWVGVRAGGGSKEDRQRDDPRAPSPIRTFLGIWSHPGMMGWVGSSQSWFGVLCSEREKSDSFLCICGSTCVCK